MNPPIPPELLLYTRVMLYALAALGSLFLLMFAYQSGELSRMGLNAAQAALFGVLTLVALNAPESNVRVEGWWDALRNYALPFILFLLIPTQWALIISRSKEKPL